MRSALAATDAHVWKAPSASRAEKLVDGVVALKGGPGGGGGGLGGGEYTTQLPLSTVALGL